LQRSELVWYSYRASFCVRELGRSGALAQNPMNGLLGTWQPNREKIDYKDETNEPKEQNHSANF